jgi:cytidine deaminase
MEEHLATDAPVYVDSGSGDGQTFTAAQLLPHAFKMDTGTQ